MPKDRNKPRRYLSPYILFCQEHRPIIKQENPTASFTDIGSMLGKKWHTLSKPEKDVYQKLSDEEKKIYDIKMKEYKEMMSQQQTVVKSE